MTKTGAYVPEKIVACVVCHKNLDVCYFIDPDLDDLPRIHMCLPCLMDAGREIVDLLRKQK